MDAGTIGDCSDTHMLLYRRGEPSDMFTLTLQGRILIRAGVCPLLAVPTTQSPLLDDAIVQPGLHDNCQAPTAHKAPCEVVCISGNKASTNPNKR